MVKRSKSSESKEALTRVDNNINNQPASTVNQSAPSTQIPSVNAEIIAEMAPLMRRIADDVNNNEVSNIDGARDRERVQNVTAGVERFLSGDIGQVACIKENLQELGFGGSMNSAALRLHVELSDLELKLRIRRRGIVTWYDRDNIGRLHAKSIGAWAGDADLLPRLLKRGLMSWQTIEGHLALVPGSMFDNDKLGELSWIVERDEFSFTDHDGIEARPVFGFSPFGAREMLRADKEVSAAIKAGGCTVTTAQAGGTTAQEPNVTR